jgi:hypothetical protein
MPLDKKRSATRARRIMSKFALWPSALWGTLAGLFVLGMTFAQSAGGSLYAGSAHAV